VSDALLTTQDREEAFSRAYVAAIAAGAGYDTYVSGLDRDSIDIGFCAGGELRPNLHAQLKATKNLKKSGNEFKFRLKRKNYDDLRVPSMVPRIVVVLALHKQELHWLSVSTQRLVIKRSAYWASLTGMGDLPASQDSITIRIPSANRFDVDGLKGLMQKARTGSIA